MKIKFLSEGGYHGLHGYDYRAEFGSEKELEKYLLSREDLFDEILKYEYRKIFDQDLGSTYHLHILGKIKNQMVEVSCQNFCQNSDDNYLSISLFRRMASAFDPKPFTHDELEEIFFKEKED